MKNSKRMVGKNEYLPPTLSFYFVKMEQEIAAGSANTVPTDSSNQVNKEWDIDPTKSTTIDW